MIRYQQEFLADCWDDAQELIQLHWEEIALNKDFIALNPDIAAYENAEMEGVLRIFTARDDGRLVGYFAVLVTHSLHYMDHTFAHNDVIFIRQDYRKGWTASNLIRFSEQCLTQDGVSVLFINTKVHKPFDILLRRLGYRHIENLYSKRL